MNSSQTASLELLRTAVRARIESMSLRHVAGEVGMSPTGLSGFLHGRPPRRQTHHRLTAWYVRTQAAEAEPFAVDAITARSALALLVHHLPAPERERALVAMLGVLQDASRRIGVRPPGWTRMTHREVRHSIS